MNNKSEKKIIAAAQLAEIMATRWTRKRIFIMVGLVDVISDSYRVVGSCTMGAAIVPQLRLLGGQARPLYP